MCFLAAVAVTAAAGFALYPWLGDDLFYRMEFKEYFLYGDTVPASRFIKRLSAIYNTDNARLSSLVMTFVQFLPQWFLAILSGLMLWVSMAAMCRLCPVRTLPAAVAAAFGMIIFMPWINHMYVFDFQVAYLWGGSFALILSVLLFSHSRSPFLELSALVVGLWQEAVGFSVFAGLLFVVLLRPRLRTHRNIAVL